MDEHSTDPRSHGVRLRGPKVDIQDYHGHTNAADDRWENKLVQPFRFVHLMNFGIRSVRMVFTFCLPEFSLPEFFLPEFCKMW